MLAIISDLHFCDGSATDKNVAAKAFSMALDDICALARSAATKDRPAHVDLVMLGDVFDLLRTERWFEDGDGKPVPLAERPWGSAEALDPGHRLPEPVLLRARAILEAVIEKNEDALAILRQEPEGVTVRRILLPGNHDRLALHDERLYARMREALDAADERTLVAEGVHPHRLEMGQYGVLARHGHEYDAWNFERYRPGADPATYDDTDYLAAPIGDPITTELAAKLPYLTRLRLQQGGLLSAAEIAQVNARLQRIEDVRPLFASLQWISYETSRLGTALGAAQAKAVETAVNEVVRELASDFRDLAFFKEWHRRHTTLLHPFGPAFQLAAVLDALMVISPSTIDDLVQKVGNVIDVPDGKDPYVADAAKEKLAAVGAQGMRFVVYGHTHDPVQRALSADEKTQDTYLNSGTFRQRVFRTADRQGFIDTEHLTYLCFFSEHEAATWRDPADPATGPAFACWMGARSH
jgi:UDP-2,3-diacylglucosamine pyrophosphatase LpxH